MGKVVDAKFKKLLGDIQKSCLKQKGFKKTGNNYRLFHTGGLSKIINFQRSMWNYGEECRFTINIGLYFQQDPNDPVLQFKEYECNAGYRIAEISKRYEGDHWWTITEATDEQALLDEFVRLMTEDVLPWLDQFETQQDVIRAAQKGQIKIY